MTKKLLVTIADVVNRTPAYQRCLNEPERYELTEDAYQYLNNELLDQLDTLGTNICQTAGRFERYRRD